MARRLLLLIGIACLQLPPIAKTSAVVQPPRHVDLPEDGKDAEFRSNSMGISKVVDLNTNTIAYKDHILKSCYIEKISTQSAWEKDRMLIVHPKLLTNEQVAVIGGHIVANFCFGWPSKILRLPTNFEVRRKRSNKQYFFVGRKPRGQTQSQYLQIGSGESPGKAEAEATRQGSKAVVYGSRGMGQAQSQSDPFSCADCFGYGGPSSTSLQTPSSFYTQSPDGGQQGGSPGRLQTGGITPGFDARPGQTGRGDIPSTDHDGAQIPGQQLFTPDGRIIGQRPGYPGLITSRPGTSEGGVFTPETSVGGPGQASHLKPPGGIGVPGSYHIHPGFPGISGTGGKPVTGQTHIPGQAQIYPGRDISTGTGGGTNGKLVPGKVPSTLYPGTPDTGGSPGQTQFPGGVPGQIHSYPGQTGSFVPGGPVTGTYLRPGQGGGTSSTGTGGTYFEGTGQVPGQFQPHPDQTGTFVQGRPGPGTHLRPGQEDGPTGTGPSGSSLAGPGPAPGPFQTHPGQTGTFEQGSPGSGTHLRPGQEDGPSGTGPSGSSLAGPGPAPGPFQTHPGQTGTFEQGRPGSGTHLRPGQEGGPSGTGPSGSSPVGPGPVPGQFQTHPGQTGTIGHAGPGSGTILRPGQTTGVPGISYPGTTGTGGGSLGGLSKFPGQFQTQPGQTDGFVLRPSQTGGTQSFPGIITSGPGTGSVLLPGQTGSYYPGGQTQESVQRRPDGQIYDHDGLQKPSGRPTYPGDVGLITPESVTIQPGQTTYYIPGGIRPRPSDGFGYYPQAGIPTSRTQSEDRGGIGAQGGTINADVSGQYRPTTGAGGEFSGTFQGRYNVHGDTTAGGVAGGQRGGQYPGISGQHTQGANGQLTGQNGNRVQTGHYPDQFTGQRYPGQHEGQWPQQQGTVGQTVGTSGQYIPGTQQTGQRPQTPGTYIPGHTLPAGSQTLDKVQSGNSHIYPGQGQQGGQTGLGQYIPGQQIHTGSDLGQQLGHVTPGGLAGHQQPTGLAHGQFQSPQSGQYPSGRGEPGASTTGQTQTPSGGQYPFSYQQPTGPLPTQTQPTTGGQYPSTDGQHAGLIPGQLQSYPGSQYPAGVGQPGFQQPTGPISGQTHVPGGQYPSGGHITGTPQQGRTIPGQGLYIPGNGITGQHTGTAGGQQTYPGAIQQSGETSGQGQLIPGSGTGGQQIYGQYPGTSGGQPGGGSQTGTGQQIYGQHPGNLVGQPTYQGGLPLSPYGQPGQQLTGRMGGGSNIYQGGATPGGGSNIYQSGTTPGSGSQIGQYQIPGALQTGQGTSEDDSNTQAQSSIQRADNETQASATSSGRFGGGTAQSQVSGSYAGTGSFSAAAGTNDGLRGAQTQVSGNADGTLSSSQGQGGRAKSQAQVQLAANTGDTTSSAQTGGLNHGTNTQVQSGIKGGMADAQANGPGSTSSQAQIGFTPYDATTNEDNAENPHNGGGTASASSGTHAGKSQVQINGKYAFGIRYNGQAQASSANAGFTSDKINLPTMKPIDFSQNPYTKPAKQQQEKTNNVRHVEDANILQIITSSTTPSTTNDEDSEYDEYEDPDTPPPPRLNLQQQAKTRSLNLNHDLLDPLENIDDHGMQLQGQLKHGDIIQSGRFIPGSPGHKIPHGFRGRVAAERPQEVYAIGANANRRGYHEGYGSGFSYQPKYAPIQYGFKSSANQQPKNFVSVTKSETGSRNIITGKKTPSMYYTQSSSCGYFTNTCVYSNGRKICLPKPKNNPDGSPIICRN